MRELQDITAMYKIPCGIHACICGEQLRECSTSRKHRTRTQKQHQCYHTETDRRPKLKGDMMGSCDGGEQVRQR